MKAFPTTGPSTDGMDLKDYFAAQAMQALIGTDLTDLQKKYALKKFEMISVLAYRFADAMMDARNKG